MEVKGREVDIVKKPTFYDGIFLGLNAADVKKPAPEGRLSSVSEGVARLYANEVPDQATQAYAMDNDLASVEKVKAQARAKAEHPFRVIKRQFDYMKTRIRGGRVKQRIRCHRA